MEIGKTLYIVKRKDWRAWLAKNHNKEKEIWLIYYKKASGKPRISYNDCVEEALCYGWIDSIAKGIDEEKYCQRFSPRRKTSVLSEMNKERIRNLIKNKQMTEFGMKAVENLFSKDDSKEFIIPKDILEELKKDKRVWENYQKFPEHYKRIRISYIERARNRGKQEFEKRLNNFIKMTAKNKRFGFVNEMR
ncbi:MAG: YdeI/OmpD-associated family protein [Candidatus Pacearchaeota archaeon]|jgi:uncharacterized protein YdeI (YjbR/CyaY-like superfamily)